MKHKIALITTVIMGLAVSAAYAESDWDKKVEKHPGYFNLEALQIFSDEDAKVEVYLREPLLKLATKFMEHDDEDLARILRKLMLVRVNVYDVDSQKARDFAMEANKTVKQLDGKGWERIVRVRDEEDHVWIYLKPSKGYEAIDGIVVIAIDDDDEAVFLNIVGEINPDDIGKLGQHFDVEELEGIHIDKKSGKTR
jgi:hypothetical protein